MEDIIVFVRYKEQMNWYLSDLRFWIFDYTEYDIDPSSRFDIAVLGTENFPIFLSNMKDKIKSVHELSRFFKRNYSAATWDESCHLFPSLFVDVDNQILYSFFTDGMSFEAVIPADWSGEFCPFFRYIPKEYRYWIINDVDLIQRFADEFSWDYNYSDNERARRKQAKKTSIFSRWFKRVD